MIRHISRKGPLLTFAALAFLFGLGLASALEWPRGSQAAASLQTSLPRRAEIRQAAELSDAFIAIADAVTPAVVRIQAERVGGAAPRRLLPPGFRDFFGPPDEEEAPMPQLAGGSGFIVSPDGLILTNNHVIEGADRITVSLVDRRSYEATVVGRDATTDVAVIRIAADRLPSVQLGNSEEARVGEWVLAVGNPGFGDTNTLDFTVTGGIISAKGRPLAIINRELHQSDNPAASYAIEDFIQTDAVINPGNSGGPLVNLRGEVIGINTAIASTRGSYEGYGFAIPANLARRVMSDLIEHGHVRRALLGISIGSVSAEDAEVYKLPSISGVRVDDFADDSPARRAGLERHDVIVAVNGERVERVGQLQRVVAQYRPGDIVDVEVVRYGEPHRFRVRLTQAPIPEDPQRRVAARGPERLGLEVAELTPTLARRYGIDRPGGAVVVRVEPLSPAQRKDVQEGERIVAIDRRTVGSASEAQALLRAARPGEVLSLVLRDRGGRTRIANIRVP